jgi:hypothetical protein
MANTFWEILFGKKYDKKIGKKYGKYFLGKSILLFFLLTKI